MALWPRHSWLVLVAADTNGKGFTVTVITSVLELTQPAVLVPLTEYVAVVVGEKATPSVTVPAGAVHV